MTNTTYNGWTNYATWRVNLEIFDGMTLDDMGLSVNSDNPHGSYELGEFLKDYTEEIIGVSSSSDNNTLAMSYALAFLSEVNWVEIAEHMIEDYTEA